MRKALSLAVLACALMVGIACSDSPSPTAPAVSATNAAVATEVALESATKVYICHGNLSDPYGVITEVGDEYYKRHYKHLQNGRDCRCTDSATPGAECTVSDGSGVDCASSCP